MNFVQSLKNIFTVMFSFFPNWFSGGLIALLATMGVSVGLSLFKRLKDIFWPF